MNQVLFHISNSPLELIDYCQNKGIVMEAYSAWNDRSSKDSKSSANE